MTRSAELGVAVALVVLASVAVAAPIVAGSAESDSGASSPTVAQTRAAAPPVVDLEIDWPGRDTGQNYVLPGDGVTFDAGGSYDPDGEIRTYAFDVNFDGTYEVVESTEPAYTHIYDSEGYRGVRVRVTDDEGNTNTTTGQVFVNAPPTARMSVSPSNPAAGESVTFDGRASSDYNGSVTYYEWRVDGTEVSNEAAFNYTFSSPGEYEVTLLVEDDEDGGPSDSVTRTVTVGQRNERPEASFSISPRPAVAGNETTLDASASSDPDGSISYYLWDFDSDGTVDENTTDPVTTHRFAYDASGDGFANVRLVVVDDDGARGEAGRDLRVVRPPPQARCTLVPDVVAPGEETTLNASASENADSYVFDVDADPQYDTDRYSDPTYGGITFAEPGTYTLGVRAYGPNGERRDEADCTLRVNAPPEANFTVSPRPAVAGTETTLDASASTDPDGSVAYYLWDFDSDGTVDENTTDPVTTHRFAYDASGGGFANVALTVVDGDGAKGRTSRDLEIERLEVGGTCGAEPRTVTPGETVTLSVDPGPAVDSFQYDRNSAGEFGEFTDSATATVTYDEVGEYEPRAKVWNDTTERSRVVPCGAVTVEEENAPPDAVFVSRPPNPEVGTGVTFDAAGATDPDGDVVRYEWDLDGDGTYETTRSRPTVTVTETYEDAGEYRIGLRVVDDDGASDATERTIRVLAPIRASCSVSAREVEPGAGVTVAIDASGNVDDVQYDPGDGEFGPFTNASETTLTYDEPGNYTPRAKVWAYPSERSLVVECPPVRVREANVPPTAAFTFAPEDPGSNDTVTFDASNSADPDGQIVRYEWDFDGDGTVDATSGSPTITHTYGSEGNRTARLVVVDDRNASAAAESLVPVVDPSSAWPNLPDWWWIVPVVVGGAGAAGWGIRKFPKKMPAEASQTGRQYAMGTFETPATSETLTVSGVGFEPDVVLLRARNQVRAPKQRADSGTKQTDGAGDRGATRRSGGLSIGSVVRRGDALEQTVVSVADDAESVDAAVGATHTGKAVDVLFHGEDRVGSLAGSVRKFTKNGFEVDFDARELPEDVEANQVVHYQAFRFDDPGSVDVGHFATPTGTGTQTVDLGTDADYVSLTACSLGGDVNSAATGEAVSISHGEAVSVPVESGNQSPPDRVEQQTVGGGVAAGANAPGFLCGHDDRALHLPFLDDGGVVGRTSARVRELGKRLELTYDAVHAPKSTTRVVTYLAMRTGDDLRPELGHVRVPAPGASRAVDVGFDPGTVAVTGVDVDRVGVDRMVSNAVPFDWSYGVAMPTVDGDTAEQVLHGSLVTDPLPHPSLPGLGAIDPIHAGVTAPAPARTGSTATEASKNASPEPGASGSPRDRERRGATASKAPESGTEAGARATHAGGSSSPSGDHSGPHDLPSGRGAAAVVLSSGEDGGIVGRDEVSVTAFTDDGFEVRSRHARSRLDERPEQRRGVLFYTAWPRLGGGSNSGDGEGGGT